MPPKTPPCSTHKIDFTEVTERSPRTVIEEARGVCAECPVLLSCLKYLESVEVAGMAGGMLESQRVLWRHRVGSTADDTSLIDTLEAGEIRLDLVLDLPGGAQTLSQKTIELVERLTNAGFTAKEIAERLGLNQGTVNYVRRERIASGISALRREQNKRHNPDVVDHRIMHEWALAQGLKSRLSEAGKVPSSIAALYHQAHGTAPQGKRRNSVAS